MKYVKDKKLLITILIYVFVTTILIIINSKIYINLINPLFWGVIITYLIINRKRNYIRSNKKYFKYMLVIACLHVALYLYLGMIFGFSKEASSYNLIAIFIQIVGIELVRNVLAIRNKNNKLVLTFITVLLILVELKYNILANVYPHKEAFFKYICKEVLTLIACNSLCTYLTLKGGFTITLLYRIPLILSTYISADWFVIATVGVLSPAIIYALFKYKFTNQNDDVRKKKQNSYNKISYVITFIFCINLVLFMVGAFKYEPITILSSSMKPNLERGDVVIFEKMSESQLKQLPINEIIIYSIEKQNIAHRIINKVEESNNVMYVTKGDNNNVADKRFVRTNQIKGKYVFHIKYIGFPAVWLYEYFNR